MSKASISILVQAQDAIDDRRKRVDGPEGNFARIAKIWSVVFGRTVTTRDVALCMIGLKFARECYSHWTDNLVDLCGYADCLALIQGDYDVEQDACQEDDSYYQALGTEADCLEKFRQHRTDLDEWAKALDFKAEPEVTNPAPWQGRSWHGVVPPSKHVVGYGITCNAEGDARRGQAAGKCACGKSQGDCDWPACATNHPCSHTPSRPPR